MNSAPGTSITPRRSTRKSIKPLQDYEDIVERSICERKVNNENDAEPTEPEQPKWTPAKVGRTSQKRNRKSRRAFNIMKAIDDDNNELQVIDNKRDTVQLDKTVNLLNDEVEVVPIQRELEEAKTVEDLAPNVHENDSNIIDNKIETVKTGEGHTNISPKEEKTTEMVVDHKTEITEEAMPMLYDIDKKEGVKNKSEDNDKMIVIDNSTVTPGEGQKDLMVEGEQDGGVAKDETFEILEESKFADEDQWEVEVLEDSIIDGDLKEDATSPIMEPLVVSDDSVEDTPVKEHKVIQTSAEKLSSTIVSTPLTATSYNRRPKGIRFPTPYRGKQSFNINADQVDQKTDNTEESDNDDEHPCELPNKFMTPKPMDCTGRSIRKRSVSLCVGEVKGSARQPPTVNRVTFHSPANRTAVIEELDLLIAQSAKKNFKTQSSPNNVTQRRKRSISIDDAWLTYANKSSSIIAPRSIETPLKRNQTPKKSHFTRTKLPNFAAIHERQFNQMENLVDHVTRKAERARVLTNSATKLVSAQKRAAATGAGLHSSTTVVGAKPKASKKIDMEAAVSAIPIAKAYPQVTKVSKSSAPLSSNMSFKEYKNLTLQAGVRPTMDQQMQIKSTSKIAPKKLETITKPTAQPKPNPITKPAVTPKKPLKPAQPTVKPAFNLSTAVPAQPQPFMEFSSSVAPPDLREDKLVQRRQRHMEMYKGRIGSARESSRQNSANIRGVRSNRRFELQMQHRRQMEDKN